MQRSHWPERALVSGSFFCALSAVHLIDKFLWDAPAEFHLSVEITLLLALFYMLSVLGLLVLAARGSPAGFAGLSLAGGLIMAADALKHGVEILQPGIWRSGLASTSLAIMLTVAAGATAITSFFAWREGRLRS